MSPAGSQMTDLRREDSRASDMGKMRFAFKSCFHIQPLYLVLRLPPTPHHHQVYEAVTSSTALRLLSYLLSPSTREEHFPISGRDEVTVTSRFSCSSSNTPLFQCKPSCLLLFHAFLCIFLHIVPTFHWKSLLFSHRRH